MTFLSDYLLESDTKFYRDYAIPIIKKNLVLFDLDNFESMIEENKNISKERQMNEAYEGFLLDKEAQYELHPKFGRYVWDINDQWYQKWNVVFSIEHMWNWVEYGRVNNLDKKNKFDINSLKPWLNHIQKRYNLHPKHQDLLYSICDYICDWNKSNRTFTLKGTFKLNTLPLFPPHWFKDKLIQNQYNQNEDSAPSYLATFLPPYKPNQSNQIPERWDKVFLKGISLKFNVEPILILSALPILGLTIDINKLSGYSQLMIVLPKSKYGNLEDQFEKEIPINYLKPCQLALSITKDIKDLHWNYVHGNIHPRNILLNNADYLAELIDITCIQRNTNNSIQYKSNFTGRWPYVAPEVILTGQTTSSDIYALGIILWQLISRITFPINGLVDPDIYRIEPIPGVLNEYESTYIDCLNNDPAKRPNAYTIHRRLLSLYNRLNHSPIPISDETLNYIQKRKEEIRSSSFHSSLKSYPNLIRNFPI